MRKRIMIVLLVLFLTGCTCEYNLNIDSTNYQENIIISSNDQTEINELNKTWQIPIDYETFSNAGDESTEYANENIYDYKLSNNQLILNHNFTLDSYNDSTAANVCFDSITIKNYNGSIIISTSNENNCFDKYPSLESLIINITTNKNVKSHNASSVRGTTYTWIYTKDNAKSLGINMVLNNVTESSSSSSSSSTSNQVKTMNKTDWGYYIFFAILLVITLIGYVIIKNKGEENNEI